MKNKISAIAFFLLITFSGFSQSLDVKYKSKVSSLDSTMKSLYEVISGAKGATRNWEFMRYLYHPNAKLIATGKTRKGIYRARYLTVEDYINTSGKWLVENGFFENELHRTVETFGNISHVFSSYECFHAKEDKKPFMRGINSVQLMNDGERWWVMNVYFTQETPNNPIPKKYLPKS